MKCARSIVGECLASKSGAKLPPSSIDQGGGKRRAIKAPAQAAIKTFIFVRPLRPSAAILSQRNRGVAFRNGSGSLAILAAILRA
jgi:hypothetical protein